MKNTKEVFYRSFEALIETIPVEKISVEKLCEKAGYPRETFYYHFKNKDDFLNHFIRFFFRNILDLHRYPLDEAKKILANEKNVIVPVFDQRPLKYVFRKNIEKKLMEKLQGIQEPERTEVVLDFLLSISLLDFLSENPDLPLDLDVLTQKLNPSHLGILIDLIKEITS